MSNAGPNTLRYVPTDSCARCGATVDTDRRAFVLANRVRDEEGDAESGNLCKDCFDHMVSALDE